jgi:signal transduction histidine kinase/ActR/RegA family two-component response regulator
VELGAASDLHQALHLCLDAALAIGGMDFGCIYLFDPDTNSFRLEVEKNLPQASTGRLAVSGRQSPYGHLIAGGRAIYRGRSDLDLPSESEAAVHGMAIFPITSEARIVGSLNVASSTDHRIAGSSVALEMVAAQIGGALERITTEQKRIRLEEQLRQSQKMEAIGTLAGGIAHDFNNILAAILGNAELAMDGVEEDSGVQRNLNQILKSSIRGRDLVRQMLTFSKTSDQDHKPLHLKPLIEETFQLLRASLPSTIDMTLHVSVGNDAVIGSEGQIQQVVMNLVSNAKQAIPDTGLIDISLHDASPAGSPAPEGIRADDYVVIAVRDTGCGIDESVRARIFEPFFTTRTVGQGTGLGLSVVYGIVKGHEGLITVESAPGKGSLFTVFLPKAEVEVEPVQKAVDHLPRGHERILFVDDEESLCVLIAERLSRLGYTVTTASSGEEALQFFADDVKRFDVVITDYTMPTMTGLTLSKELLHMRPGLPIILCTGYSERVSREVAQQLGIAEFLMKPITKKELADTIRTVLDRRTNA